MKTRWAMIGAGVLMLAGCAVESGPVGYDVPDPYYYSPNYCEGCWYGVWGGRTGYHRGGGRPWEREHSVAGHQGPDPGRNTNIGSGYWRPATPQDLNDPNVKQNESGQVWETGRHPGHR